MDERDRGGVDFLAARLGITEGAIYAMMRRGADLPPCLQIGQRKVWRGSVIDRWIEEHEAKPIQDTRRAEAGGTRKAKPKPPPKHSSGKNKGGRPRKEVEVTRRTARAARG